MTPCRSIETRTPLLLAASWLAIARCLAAAAPDPLVIEPVSYANDAAAQAAWQPMRGSAPVTLATLEGRRALRLDCRFAGTTLERASWDRRVKLDLASGRGVRFDLFCRDASPVSYFSLYFQSGAGWYHASFYPESLGAWDTVTLDKTAFSIEGQPAGWGQIETIRLSAWRARDVDTQFYVANLRQTGVLGTDALVAILRADSASQSAPAEARTVARYTEATARHLYAAEVGVSLISDLDLDADRLRGARLVILPYNPSMPEAVVDQLARYVDRGGRLLVFYAVPEKLRARLGVQGGEHIKAPLPGAFAAIRVSTNALPGAPSRVRQRSWNIAAFAPVPGAGRVLAEWLDERDQPTGRAAIVGSTNGLVMTHVLLADDAENQRRLLLAMAGLLVPEVWRQAAEASLARLGQVGGCTSLSDLTTALEGPAGRKPAVRRALESAQQFAARARQQHTQGDSAGALELSAAAGQQALEAYCRAQSPQTNEFRAFWCHSAFGVEGMTWDEALGRLAENGFNAILPNLLWGGAAFYPSQVLPMAPTVDSRGDQVALCLAAARKHGIQVHVWKVNWNLGSAAPAEFVEPLRRAGRLQSSFHGQEEPWLCPSHPENRQLEIASMVEIARNYDVDGLHFDYIRYPDAEHCFCAGCRARFEQASGFEVKDWPKDTVAEGPLRQSWLEWRRTNITAVVRAVSDQARAVRPGIKISAAVFPNWPSSRDSIGQDAKLWCEQRWLDFVCPMDYTPSTRRFEGMVQAQLEWAGRTPCYPGIGVSASSAPFGPDRAIEQILVTRQYRTGGFVIFNFGVAECRDLLPLLGLGITARSER